MICIILYYIRAPILEGQCLAAFCFNLNQSHRNKLIIVQKKHIWIGVEEPCPAVYDVCVFACMCICSLAQLFHSLAHDSQPTVWLTALSGEWDPEAVSALNSLVKWDKCHLRYNDASVLNTGEGHSSRQSLLLARWEARDCPCLSGFALMSMSLDTQSCSSSPMITWMSLDFQLEQIWWIVSHSTALW